MHVSFNSRVIRFYFTNKKSSIKFALFFKFLSSYMSAVKKIVRFLLISCTHCSGTTGVL